MGRQIEHLQIDWHIFITLHNAFVSASVKIFHKISLNLLIRILPILYLSEGKLL